MPSESLLVTTHRFPAVSVRDSRCHDVKRVHEAVEGFRHSIQDSGPGSYRANLDSACVNRGCRALMRTSTQ